MQSKRRPLDIPGYLYEGHTEVANGRLVGTLVTTFPDTNKGQNKGTTVPEDMQFIVAGGDLQGKTTLTFRAPGMKETPLTVNALVRANPPTYEVAIG